MAWYSKGRGTTVPGVVISSSCSNVALTIAVCCSTLWGAPAFAPMGTRGATARGVPVCLTTGGRAAMMMVGIPTDSIALCTRTAERWQVPQPAVINTASTPSSLRRLAIAGPVSWVNFSMLPPPPMKPI